MKYDAFISYKHGEIDGAVALKLQTLLEHLRVPGDKKDVKKIERVFMDTGELSSSADFVEQVESALKESEWLIVLCSPGSKASPWCKLEVDTYLKYHDMSHILLLLTEGEPEDVFPDRLLEEDNMTLHILAADCRGENKKEILKNLKKSAVYKLAATMMALSYDDLKQRRKTYLMQRVAAASIAALLILSCFTGYIIYQAGQVARNYQKAQENQARYLTTISSGLLAGGDSEQALLTATALQPKKAEDGPLVPEQIYSLNEALGSYKAGLYYHPEEKLETGKYSGYHVSDDLRYAYIENSKKLTVIDNTTHEKIWTYKASDSEFSKIMPYGADLLFVMTYKNVILLNIPKQKVVYEIDGIYSFIDLKQDTLLLGINGVSDIDLHAYNAKDGSLLQTLDTDFLKTKESDVVKIHDIAVSQNGTKAAVGFEPDDMDQYYNRSGFCGVVLYDLTSGGHKVITDQSANSMAFIDNRHLAMILQKSAEYEEEYHFSMTEEKTNNYSYHLYDQKKDKMVFSKVWKEDSRVGSPVLKKMTLTLDGKKIPVAVFSAKGDLTLINLKNYKLISNIYFHNNIQNVSANNQNSFFVALSTGQVQSVSFMGGNNHSYYHMNVCSLDTTINDFYYLKEQDSFLFFGKNNLFYCKLFKDSNYKEMDYGENQDLESRKILYVTAGEETVRIIFHRSLNDYYADTALSAYHLGEAKPFAQWRSESDGKIKDCQFFDDGGHLIANIIEETTDTNQQYLLHQLDLTENREIFQVSLQDLYRYTSKVAYSKDGKTMYLSDSSYSLSRGVAVYDLAAVTTSLGKPVKTFHEDGLIGQMTMTGDGRYLFLIDQRTAKDGSNYFTGTIYDLETLEGKEVALSSDELKTLYYNTLYITASPYTNYIYLYIKDGESYLLQADQPEEPVNLGSDLGSAIAFFKQDQYLIFFKNDTLCFYDLAERKIVSRFEDEALLLKLFTNASITTDQDEHMFVLSHPDSFFTDFSNDAGLIFSPTYLFYVDDDLNIYLHSRSMNTYVSPAGKEVVLKNNKINRFTTLYSYEELLNQAKERLDGKSLSNEELKEIIKDAE